MTENSRVTTKFYRYRQNNSGDDYTINLKKGLGPIVYVEAVDADHANQRAQNLGIYFDGVHGGMDCECCGDRWDTASERDAAKAEDINENKQNVYGFLEHPEYYIHLLDGRIEVREAVDAYESKNR